MDETVINLTDINQLNDLKANDAVFILFGGATCGVCKSLRKQFSHLLKQQFPSMKAVYVDCGVSPEICAQHSVFSLPVVEAYIHGMKVVEQNGAFSVKQLMQKLQRPYTMWQETGIH